MKFHTLILVALINFFTIIISTNAETYYLIPDKFELETINETPSLFIQKINEIFHVRIHFTASYQDTINALQADNLDHREDFLDIVKIPAIPMNFNFFTKFFEESTQLIDFQTYYFPNMIRLDFKINASMSEAELRKILKFALVYGTVDLDISCNGGTYHSYCGQKITNISIFNQYKLQIDDSLTRNQQDYFILNHYKSKIIAIGQNPISDIKKIDDHLLNKLFSEGSCRTDISKYEIRICSIIKDYSAEFKLSQAIFNLSKNIFPKEHSDFLNIDNFLFLNLKMRNDSRNDPLKSPDFSHCQFNDILESEDNELQKYKFCASNVKNKTEIIFKNNNDHEIHSVLCLFPIYKLNEHDFKIIGNKKCFNVENVTTQIIDFELFEDYSPQYFNALIILPNDFYGATKNHSEGASASVVFEDIMRTLTETGSSLEYDLFNKKVRKGISNFKNREIFLDKKTNKYPIGLNHCEMNRAKYREVSPLLGKYNICETISKSDNSVLIQFQSVDNKSVCFFPMGTDRYGRSVIVDSIQCSQIKNNEVKLLKLNKNVMAVIAVQNITATIMTPYGPNLVNSIDYFKNCMQIFEKSNKPHSCQLLNNFGYYKIFFKNFQQPNTSINL